MKLDEWLNVRRITASDFARSIGIHAANLSNYRKGTRSPSFAAVRAIYTATEGEVGLMDWPEPKSARAVKWKARAAKGRA